MAYKITKPCAKPHLIIDAGPGSGKTSTMIAGLNILFGNKPSWFKKATDEQHDIWKAMEGNYTTIGFQAFNKSIAEELKTQVPRGVEAKTFHSFGFAALRANGYNFKANGDSVGYFVKDAMGYDKTEMMKRPDFDIMTKTKKVVAMIKNHMLSADTDVILAMCDSQNLDLNGSADSVIKYAKASIEKSLSIKQGEFTWIDFDDMIWLPIALDMDFGNAKFDLLICDEAQDLNPVQHEMICRSADRLICVGDKRQSIYGFRGADVNSIANITTRLGATTRGVETYPLMTSFRLPKSGVRNVNEFAPGLRALDNAIEGTINSLFADEAKPVAGDLIVSRINANIFTMAFRLLREKVAVRIQGREYGDTLKAIITRECEITDTIDKAQIAISNYNDRELTRLNKRTFAEKLIDAHNEKISCLYSLSGGCATVKEMLDTIDVLFGNDLPRSKVVLLSTVHRAKGLEADNVFFLEPSLVPHPMAKLPHEKQQELNLKFVAETRHMKTLTYVSLRKNDDDRDAIDGRVIADRDIETLTNQV